MVESRWNRRRFLKVISTAAAAASVNARGIGEQVRAVAIVVNPTDGVAASKPVNWAIEHLTQALRDRNVTVSRVPKMDDASDGSICIIAAGANSNAARKMLLNAKVSLTAMPESLAFVNLIHEQKRSLLACGRDSRGLVYALTELADLVRNAPDPMTALTNVQTIVEQPANEVRSITRLFCSEVEDKPWYYDREMWPAYFDMLATHRFNRFNLAFGIGYDFIRKVTDAYFLFTYPFLLKVPGYNVRVPQLPDEERDRNLKMLQYISEQCVMRGLEFHIGLWMHGYEWIDSPDANSTIEGLDKNTHGPYCRDAVRLLLQQVPNIHGLTFRIHGESGVQEGSFDFWRTVFDGVATCGRQVPIDMHPKGMSQQMIDVALGTGQPLSMSPKFWAEHLGMTYHQGDIRKQEKPRSQNKTGLMALSDGTRSFLRYGYGDLLSEDRKWTVVHRVWSGTQRILLWGDPLFAAAYSKAFQFCGSNGVELQEPLSFKGRRGSGRAGSRCGYADAAYDPRWDWQKYEYSTRIWGRLLYNPDTKPEVWQRSLQRLFGAGAHAIETALANVSRILPAVTTAYAPSAANNSYWPELYYNQSMVDSENYEPYSDSPEPRVFGNASPLDPELFLSMNEYAGELLKGRFSGKFSPVEVAQWIEDFAKVGRAALAEAEASASRRNSAAYRRAKADIEIQAGLGEFFGAKFRSGVLFHLYEVTKERAPLEASIAQYRFARAAWAKLANVAKNIYVADINVGEHPQLRGHWLDRLPAIDKDIAALSTMLNSAKPGDTPRGLEEAIQRTLGRPRRASIDVHHTVPGNFKRGQALSLTISVPGASTGIQLHYRHVDQAENYEAVPMEHIGSKFVASIPATYTQTFFPLEYFFEITMSDGKTALHPGFKTELTNQPYFIVRSTDHCTDLRHKPWPQPRILAMRYSSPQVRAEF